MGIIADTLAASLKAMAESDARLYRGLDQYVTGTRQSLLEASTICSEGDLEDQISSAIALLEEHGYTVTR